MINSRAPTALRRSHRQRTLSVYLQAPRYFTGKTSPLVPRCRQKEPHPAEAQSGVQRTRTPSPMLDGAKPQERIPLPALSLGGRACRGAGSSAENTETVLGRALRSLFDVIALREKHQHVHRLGRTQKEQSSATCPSSKYAL